MVEGVELPAIVGRAVAMIEISIEASKTDSISDPSTGHSRVFVIPGTVELVAIVATVGSLRTAERGHRR